MNGLKPAALSLLACFLCVCCLASCGKEMPGRLDGQYPDALTSQTFIGHSSGESDDEASSQAGGGENDASSGSDEKAYPAPAFRAGSYTMESSGVNEQYIYSGKSVVSFTRVTQIYDYDIRLAVRKNGSMSAVYTFSRIRTGYETPDGSDKTDTNDKKGRNDDNAVYYDLIGQSFTAEISKDYSITLKGIDLIHKKYPYTADVVTDENMKEVVADLFYKMGSSLQSGSRWKLKQVGVTNTYTVASVKNGSVYINIKGTQLDIPEPFTRDGVKYTYQKREPLSGSLVISMDNRMVQEQSSYQENSGVIESGDRKYTFTESAASICNIKMK